jgi:hypothetical protein
MSSSKSWGLTGGDSEFVNLDPTGENIESLNRIKFLEPVNVGQGLLIFAQLLSMIHQNPEYMVYASRNFVPENQSSSRERNATLWSFPHSQSILINSPKYLISHIIVILLKEIKIEKQVVTMRYEAKSFAYFV